MRLALKPEDERFIEEQVTAGRFASPEAAVAEAIDRLRWGDDDVVPTAGDLAAVREGLDQLDRGEGIPWEEARRALDASANLGDPPARRS